MRLPTPWPSGLPRWPIGPPARTASRESSCAVSLAGRLEQLLNELWDQRLVPFEQNLRSGRRAPRLQTPVVVAPDPSWPVAARRVIARLELAIGAPAVRIDHIGSTSVPGLPAKNLIDLQVVVANLGVAKTAAQAASAAGVVHVSGSWFGADRDGQLHPDTPVWRDTLLLRDWLRQDAVGRADYAALKRSLAARRPRRERLQRGQDAWIRDALGRAERWAAVGNWSP